MGRRAGENWGKGLAWLCELHKGMTLHLGKTFSLFLFTNTSLKKTNAVVTAKNPPELLCSDNSMLALDSYLYDDLLYHTWHTPWQSLFPKMERVGFLPTTWIWKNCGHIWLYLEVVPCQLNWLQDVSKVKEELVSIVPCHQLFKNTLLPLL